MENSKQKAKTKKLEEIHERFLGAVVESYYGENGELVYILKQETDLEEYAGMIKTVLSSKVGLDLTQVVRVTNQDQSHYVNIAFFPNELENL